MRRRKPAFWVTLLLISMMVSVWALAANLLTYGNHELAYEGVLERDGTFATGDFDFVITLYDDPVAGNAVWSDVFTATPVALGQFSLSLGSGAPLSDEVFESAVGLYIGLEVRENTVETEFVPLDGRQKLAHAPFAVRSELANDFQVAGTLAVGTQENGHRWKPGASAPRMTVQGGDDAAIKIYEGDPENNPRIMTIDGNELNASGEISFQWETKNAIHLHGDVELRSEAALNLGAGSVANIKSNASCDCIWVGSINDYNPNVTGFAGGVGTCPSGAFIAGIIQEADCGSNDNCINQIQCCRPCGFIAE